MIIEGHTFYSFLAPACEWVPESGLFLHSTMAETLGEFRYIFSVGGPVWELALAGERWPFTHFRGAKGDYVDKKR